MISKTSIFKRSIARKAAICFVSTAIAILTFGSSGGGGGDKKTKNLNRDFTPIRTTGGFTLKAGPMYGGSQLLNVKKQKDVVFINTVVTYQRGNTTFILPYKYKMTKPAAKSNLNAVDVKINLGK